MLNQLHYMPVENVRIAMPPLNIIRTILYNMNGGRLQLCSDYELTKNTPFTSTV